MNNNTRFCKSTQQGDLEGLKIYLVVGEPSGDILASRLIRAIRAKQPNTEFFGIGGETMQAEGFQSLFNIKDLSVMGVMEVIPKLPVILRLRRAVLADIDRVQPDVVVTVDSWGFINSILKILKSKGNTIPKVHYVAPQVWAWKKGRAKKAAQLIDHLMTLLPNEPPYFEKYGLDCTFVGHPVIENTANLPTDIPRLRAKAGIPDTARVLCILPGSRHSEVSRLSPIFIECIERLAKEIPNLFLLIPSVEAMREEIEGYFKHIALPYKMVVGQQARYEAFCMSEFALAASGTVSLELTACGTPHVIAYTFNPLTNLIAELLAITKYANLINILADRFIIPEFVLRNCRADLIVPEVLSYLQSEEKRNKQMEQASEQLAKLKPKDMLPSEKAAEVVLNAI
ncbi:MAG: lipid-A-disaccharide synthase [Prevotellaceae bacterium]|jgi:lipid-A-disaccharide synthase|nr:lipid-A-disaccharide synthase [Prevotellaceae bacterium]